MKETRLTELRRIGEEMRSARKTNASNAKIAQKVMACRASVNPGSYSMEFSEYFDSLCKPRLGFVSSIDLLEWIDKEWQGIPGTRYAEVALTNIGSPLTIKRAKPGDTYILTVGWLPAMRIREGTTFHCCGWHTIEDDHTTSSFGNTLLELVDPIKNEIPIHTGLTRIRGLVPIKG